MHALIFYDDSPLKADVEDIVPRSCMLISFQIGTKFHVALVKNTNAAHHRNNHMPFVDNVIICKHLPVLSSTLSSWISFGKRVTSVDFEKVKPIALIYVNIYKCFNRLSFVNATNSPITAYKCKLPIEWLS
jgi:hypothetical protein